MNEDQRMKDALVEEVTGLTERLASIQAGPA